MATGMDMVMVMSMTLTVKYGGKGFLKGKNILQR